MKHVFIISLVLIAVLACKQKKSDVVTAEPQNKEIPLWVNYEANLNPKGKSIVLVSGDEEYRSEEALPQLAKILSQHHGFDCTVLFAQDPKDPGVINPNHRHNIPGLHLLKEADMVIWFTRFRELPSDQMKNIENYLLSGKPLLGIRTATHAFNFEDKNHPFVHYSWNYKGEKEDWHLGFGKQILGETWFTHHGDHKHQSTRGIISKSIENHPILSGIQDGSIWGATDVYGVRTPISEDAQILVYGQSIDREGDYDEEDLFYGMRETDKKLSTHSGPDNNRYDPNAEMPPLVWLKNYQIKNGKKGQALTSTVGAASDLLDEEVRRLLVNASYYLLNISVPESANVSLIDEYIPNQFGFHDDTHWIGLNLKVQDLIAK